jgi:hypothetical protein
MNNLTHIIVGEAASKVLLETIALEESLQGTIITLTDDYHLGPIYTAEGESFHSMRNAYWQTMGKILAENYISDEQRIIDLINNKSDDSKCIFWMAPNAQDVSAYYWLLSYFQKHKGLLHVIFIDSLPFFNEKGILYYPKSFAQLLPKEMVKCRHLIKELSAADYELEMDEWTRISGENGMVRSHEVGKKLSTRNETHFDGAIYLSITNNFVKANKILASCMNKGGAQANETFMANRIKKLVENNSFIVQGDTNKALKDFEIKSNKSNSEEEELAAIE